MPSAQSGGPLRELLDSVSTWGQWVLHDRAPVAGPQQLARGRVALLGDAAHPMRPYLAQGAAMALEDAFEMGRCLQAVSDRVVDVPTAPLWLDGDLTRLAQVMGNLLNNAAKYTPAGGRIELSARVERVHSARPGGVVLPMGRRIRTTLRSPEVFPMTTSLPTDPQNDADHDGLCAGVDNCPAAFNPTRADRDGDQYILNGQPVAKLTAADRARVRNREIGFIFQSFNLIGDLTVYENVDLPLTYRGLSTAERKQRAQRQQALAADRQIKRLIGFAGRAG